MKKCKYCRKRKNKTKKREDKRTEKSIYKNRVRKRNKKKIIKKEKKGEENKIKKKKKACSTPLINTEYEHSYAKVHCSYLDPFINFFSVLIFLLILIVRINDALGNYGMAIYFIMPHINSL